MIVAWLMTCDWPSGYKPHDGPKWCKAIIVNFQRYEKRSVGFGNTRPEQKDLSLLVRRDMLRLKPGNRLSVRGCLDQGIFLWRMLDQESEVHSNRV